VPWWCGDAMLPLSAESVMLVSVSVDTESLAASITFSDGVASGVLGTRTRDAMCWLEFCLKGFLVTGLRAVLFIGEGRGQLLASGDGGDWLCARSSSGESGIRRIGIFACRAGTVCAEGVIPRCLLVAVSLDRERA